MVSSTKSPTYTRFTCIGAGFSGIGLGATLKRWYGITDVQLFERHDHCGGTWFANSYPGAACDVPSALYSFSFETNPDWSRVLPTKEELWKYLTRVAEKYDLIKRMKFNCGVERAEWIEESARWRLAIRDLKTDATFIHETQFLFSGTGQLVTTRDLNIPGAETFKGDIFHSARWDHDVDVTNKNVIVVGNGYTGNQIVPSIVVKTKHTTHLVRSKHWIMPPIDASIPPWLRALFKSPGAMTIQRFLIFLAAERSLQGFRMTPKAQQFRNRQRARTERYIRSTAPAKWHGKLIPDFEVGCKRRIFDSGYLKCLNRDNVTLTDEKAIEVVPEGIRTESGVIEADVIVLANGFKTNYYFGGIEIIGRGGVTMQEHWESFGGPEAYNCTSMSDFPNFFCMQGPNSATGHTSGVMAIENAINYGLRVLKPCIEGQASVADVRREAEEAYVDDLQGALQNTVWSSGCSSWYINGSVAGKTWNAMSYPYSQGHFWYRCPFPKWSDWEYSVSCRAVLRPVQLLTCHRVVLFPGITRHCSLPRCLLVSSSRLGWRGD